ncbi:MULTISPECIES: glutamine synthetase III family protein [Dethiosulfovibrio]|uniref:Glutamine synthetase III n=2 Tax=Dethiosulfovibrio TaxID=47054 RepID=A0ABS9EKM4_9BACT|nr:MULTISPECIES: glutamine synthetase III [Dethiosulfovibrio]MCF4113838.1 glutamine synthetase III [Dethiosulfovibrio russensis]MCF4141749.1 glutamine synthetase III [Dethiosulfovibrio marinus]MCF4143834.1 glutamine synthetase III [Dethiosulfovibrio acidaminovorans]
MEISRPKEIFGMNVLDRKTMKEVLPDEIYRKLVTAIEGGQKLDISVADFVATAMKEWAVSKGATHYTHWFLPRTETTAEKHMAFLTTDESGAPMDSFSGMELVRSEPDASSFPSGGIRSTFEARGYSTWDPSSPAFVVRSPKGATLCIPSVFISYDGTPLDMKTPLLKSIDVVRNKSMRLLKLFGNRSVRSVDVTVGGEQEYFLVDEEKARKRPDIMKCGRTLIGAPSPLEQTVEAHYFGSIHPRTLAYMEDVERDMYRMGQILKTRHNEVAPCQFEFAPDIAEGNLGCDQNHILMEIMKKMAIRHGFKLMLHEKPFAGVNGSGKHLNFSLRDSEGRNLLKPSSNQRRNIQFLTFLSAFLLGVSKHGGLLRAAIASPGNMHRLGGHEAPPAIMSVYLGDLLTQILDNIEKGLPDKMPSRSLIDLGLNRLPAVVADNSDRNRTSPIAFTGNKFEFRAVGAPQALAGPLTVLLAVWSKGIEEMTSMIEHRISEGRMDVTDAALEAIRHGAKESRAVRFEGNAYAPEWQNDAAKRGLTVANTTPEALDLYLIPENRSLFADLGIMTEREVEAYHEIRTEQYVNAMDVEMATMTAMIREGVLPAVTRQISLESEAIRSLPEELRKDMDPWNKSLKELVTLKNGLITGIENLDDLRQRANNMNLSERARIVTEEALPQMAAVRGMSDAAEQLVAGDIWPYPRYRDLLTTE